MASEPSAVDVNIYCSIATEKLTAFSALLQELSGLVASSAIEHLNQIIVVADGEVATTVNAVLEAATGEPGHYQTGEDYTPLGAAVPTEIDGALLCFIVLNEKIIQVLDESRYHEPNTVSTVLEELLHVEVYAAAWKRRGFLFPKHEHPCDGDLYAIASRMCDEYVVNRKKARIAASVYLFDTEDGKGRMTGHMLYGGNVQGSLDKAAVRLREAIANAAAARLQAIDAWRDVTDCVYRLIFDPLTRDAAFLSDLDEGQRLNQNAQKSQFYREYVSTYWAAIRLELELIFASELAETEACRERIMGTIRSFLENIGIVYRKTSSDGCWVNFYPGSV